MTWNERADVAQESLRHFFGAPEPQYLNNWYPDGPDRNAIFNYWWLAHVMDARLDAFERTGDDRWLARTVEVRDNLVVRNGGGLFNDYFDDMLWFALALERLARLGRGRTAGGRPVDADAYLAESSRIWEHCLDTGWNDVHGPSMSWRVQQPYYKNTPANGPFAILGARLAVATGRTRYLEVARRALDWIEGTLRRTRDGFVEDGIDREEDGRVDTQWRFTYNQGLYVGACVALAGAGADDGEALLDRAGTTLTTALAELTVEGVFADEGPDGDEGLFKGVLYRYATLLDEVRPHDGYRAFLVSSTDALWAHGLRDGYLLPANDWRRPADGPIPYSTMLSAIMATESRARG